ncbi:hypothetical protein AB0D34_44470 [Streptomyces sp. NPDC048420]|uniref:hypothetical protein n=1 Tax=Streptomyces sp. NPDC048420 TaxID=3155755 RepID=UPI0034484329
MTPRSRPAGAPRSRRPSAPGGSGPGRGLRRRQAGRQELDYRSELSVLLDDRDTGQALIGQLLPLKEQFAGTAGGAYATRPLAHALADLYLLMGERPPAADAYALAERVAHVWDSPHHVAAARRRAARLAGS